MVAGIIVAGGIGLRTESILPKQFEKINNKEIYKFSVDTFIESDNIDLVIVVCHKDWIGKVSKSYPNIIVCNGGTTRRESVINGLRLCNNDINKVLIHDAARPFVDKNIIDKLIKSIKTSHAAAPYININDSILQDNGNQIIPLNREMLKAIQTPQAFRKKFLDDIVLTNEYNSDEIGLLARLNANAKIDFIKGSQKYNKITTKLDLKHAQAIGGFIY